MKIRLLFLFGFLLFVAGRQVTAQNTATYRITGKVVDETQQALEFATVRIFTVSDSSLAAGGVTDAEGRFNFLVDAGQYYLIAQFVSFQEQIIQNIQLGPQNPVIGLGAITLRESSQVLSEIEVVAERSEMELSLDKRVFNIGQDLATLGGNAIEILNNVPSVQVDVEGNVSLRGSQNVRILIDGRPSGLAGVSSTDALRLLQGNLIDRIEVITNPSARYDAEGEVGIINIILKKEKRKGLNGSFDLTTGYPENFGGAFTLNFRQKWINFFGSVGLNYRRAPGFGESFQTFFDEGGDINAAFRRDQDRNRRNFGQTFRGGADIFLNERNTLTFSGLFRMSDGNNDTFIRFDDFDGQGNFTQTVIRTEDETETDDNVEFNLNYKRTFARKGQEWVTDFKWILTDNTELADLFEENQTLATAFNQRSSNTEDEENFFFQSDYIHPLGKKGKFETGTRITLRTIDNDFLVEELNGDNEWVALSDFDNRFIFQEDVYAFYLMAGNQWGKFSAQAGLRAEYTDIQARLKETNEANDRDFLDFFPSAHFSYELSNKQTIQFSYSRRLSRPNYRLLLPFSNFSDSRNFRAGNPALNPEYTHSFELGYLQNWKSGNVFSSIYYRYRTGVIERITLVDENNFSIIFPVNLAQQNAYGLEFTFTQDLAPWWTLNGNANIYWALTEGAFEDQSLRAEVLTMNSRLASRFKLPQDFDLQATVLYSAPQNTTQGRMLSMTVLNLGLSRDILKGNGTLTLSVQDVFNSQVRRSITQGVDFFADSRFQWRARQWLLNFNYRLNQKKQRGGRERGEREGGFEGGDW
ncbi:MAG: outer membrane beta-barrel family protein [Microscillaceae bacterium]